MSQIVEGYVEFIEIMLKDLDTKIHCFIINCIFNLKYHHKLERKNCGNLLEADNLQILARRTFIQNSMAGMHLNELVLKLRLLGNMVSGHQSGM